MLEKELLENFFLRRNKALVEFDLEFIKEVCSGVKDEKMLTVILHKARYDCVSIDDSYRLDSKNWLIENDYKPMWGGYFLPGDDLPE